MEKNEKDIINTVICDNPEEQTLIPTDEVIPAPVDVPGTPECGAGCPDDGCGAGVHRSLFAVCAAGTGSTAGCLVRAEWCSRPDRSGGRQYTGRTGILWDFDGRAGEH